MVKCVTNKEILGNTRCRLLLHSKGNKNDIKSEQISKREIATFKNFFF